MAYNACVRLQRQEYTIDILNAMEALSKEGAVPKWGCGLQDLDRRNVFIGELSRVGIKKPNLIGTPSVRNDAAFLYTLVGVTSVVAVAAGQLPGDWVSSYRALDALSLQLTSGAIDQKLPFKTCRAFLSLTSLAQSF